MDRDMILRHLEQARKHVAEGERTLGRQRDILAELERDGHDTARARALLSQFEEIQRLHLEDRDRLVKELAHASR